MERGERLMAWPTCFQDPRPDLGDYHARDMARGLAPYLERNKRQLSVRPFTVLSTIGRLCRRPQRQIY